MYSKANNTDGLQLCKLACTQRRHCRGKAYKANVALNPTAMESVAGSALVGAYFPWKPLLLDFFTPTWSILTLLLSSVILPTTGTAFAYISPLA